MCLRISLLSVNEAGKQDWITDEENGSVITDQIPNSFIGVEFQSKSAWITSSISRTAFTAYAKKIIVFNLVKKLWNEEKKRSRNEPTQFIELDKDDKDEYIPTVENRAAMG